MRATRDPSGWNTAEPVPTKAAASNSTRKLSAFASSSNPIKVAPMPAASE